ncbi:MAG TPA: Gfo/Idh/MocA family oxidoreductase [Fimbriimonadaceae bacterium]|nr:Gfo/Idh/MocA family oxidoreductase [Fimbriimonadaceae bacterium]HRJ96375.1 Gfo/Idh/MocA family oxidoreductase [Fimbriimonadaceae bacterium]
MADRVRWGILATGSIARAFAAGLRESETGELRAVGSRTKERAGEFVAEFGGEPYGSYEGVLSDPDVDAVYIATPHHLHAENTIAAAHAGKAILCEKPFTLTAADTERAIAAVRAAGVFFMEAFMYRCHPQTRQARDWLRNGAIGRILQVNAEFGFAASRDWPSFRTDGRVGGGGLMDVGTYCVSFARMAVGEEPIEAHYLADVTERGYDASGAGILHFPGGAVAHFGTGIHVALRNDVTVYGEAGRLHIEQPWKCAGGAMTLTRGDVVETVRVDTSNAGLYAIEADAVAHFMEEGECPYMTIEDTVGNSRCLDRLRQSAGLCWEDER